MSNANTSSAPVLREKPGHKVTVGLLGVNHPAARKLIELLHGHPKATLKRVSCPHFVGQSLPQIFPEFQGQIDLKISAIQTREMAAELQVVFVALEPSEESRQIVTNLRKSGLKIIELQPISAPSNCYGLSEIFAEDIKKSPLVQLPQAAASAILLTLAPFLQNQIITPDDIVCDVKSSPLFCAPHLRYVDLHENILQLDSQRLPYTQEVHKHLNELSKEQVKVEIQHTVFPIANGLFMTIYTKPFLREKTSHYRQILERFYRHYPFVQTLGEEHQPSLKTVLGTNQCQIHLQYDDAQEKLVFHTLMDETLKASAGQALECLNLMYGLESALGLPLS